MLLRVQGGAIDAFAALSPKRGYIYDVQINWRSSSALRYTLQKFRGGGVALKL